MQLRPLSKHIFQAIGVFSGVKVLSIACSLVRNKLIAIFVGPAGMGLISLYLAATEMLGAVSRLSIDQSAVRDIAADASGQHVDEISAVVRRWSLWLGIAGALLMCILSPLLSLWMNGDTSLWGTFCALSLVPLSSTIAVGRTSLMTGLNMLGRLAKTSAWSAVASVLVTTGLLWWLGENSIVPLLIANALVALAVTLIFSPRSKKITLTAREIRQKGAGFIRLGILMTAATFLSYLFSYLFVIYLNHTASTSDVGIYQIGFTLLNTYVGVIFAGVWVEYYPRLSRAIHSQRATSAIVCHEIAITLCVLLPVAMAFIAADKLIVTILYARNFLDVLPFLSIGIIGIVFRTFSWCLGFVIMARGDGATYVITEGIDAVIGLVFNIAGWNLGGFAGLGVSYVCWYVVYCFIVYFIYRRRYRLHMPLRLIGFTMLIAAAVTATLVMKIYFGWIAAALLSVAAVPLCLSALKRRARVS